MADEHDGVRLDSPVEWEDAVDDVHGETGLVDQHAAKHGRVLLVQVQREVVKVERRVWAQRLAQRDARQGPNCKHNTSINCAQVLVLVSYIFDGYSIYYLNQVEHNSIILTIKVKPTL